MTSDRGAATYVFCLVEAERSPSVRGAPKGLPGAGAPRPLAVDRGLWAIVADAPLSRFSSEQLQQDLQDVEAVSRHALAHAGIVEFFFRRSPVIPLKLFTMFSGDERAQQDLRGRSARVRKLFALLRGLEEWGVRVTAPAESPVLPEKALSSGRDYLERKRRLQVLAKAPSRGAGKEGAAVVQALGRLAAKTQKERFPAQAPGRPQITGASFLVKRDRRAKWKVQVARQAARIKGKGHRLELSGPWPPYHFVR